MTKIKWIFDKTVEWLIVIIFISFSLMMLTNVVGRYFFYFSFTWSDEFVRYTFIWMILLASGVAVKRKAHLGFDLILVKLPPKLRIPFAILNDLLVGCFLILFFFKGIDLLKSAGMTPSPSLHIPVGVVYLILPLSAAIMFIYLIESIKDTLTKGLVGPTETEEEINN